jgi:hypothetical protein
VDSFFALQGEKRTHQKQKPVSSRKFYYQEKSTIMTFAGINPIIAIIIGLLLIGLVFRIIKGVVRLVLIVGIFAFLAYIVLNYAR